MAKPTIAVKNLQGLTELMQLEQLAYKKYSTYSKSLKDPDLKEMCLTNAESHKLRFDAMYDYLEMHE